MKLTNANKKRLKRQLKALNAKGGALDQDQLVSALVYELQRTDAPQHNLCVSIAKGILGLDEGIENPRFGKERQSLEELMV